MWWSVVVALRTQSSAPPAATLKGSSPPMLTNTLTGRPEASQFSLNCSISWGVTLSVSHLGSNFPLPDSPAYARHSWYSVTSVKMSHLDIKEASWWYSRITLLLESQLREYIDDPEDYINIQVIS
ncbi:hypothetical protein GmHk_03G006460 [Glycine max]|nr:hypothetical protein GmHk_03G006460 [Glycine max]